MCQIWRTTCLLAYTNAQEESKRAKVWNTYTGGYKYYCLKADTEANKALFKNESQSVLKNDALVAQTSLSPLLLPPLQRTLGVVYVGNL